MDALKKCDSKIKYLLLICNSNECVLLIFARTTILGILPLNSIGNFFMLPMQMRIASLNNDAE